MINLDIIPANLESSLRELFFGLEDIVAFRAHTEENLVWHTHNSLGCWIRNNWALWEGSLLSEYFEDLGIGHPDDMSSIIIKSLWLTLNNKPINLEGQIENTKEYWRKQGFENGIFTKEKNKNI